MTTAYTKEFLINAFIYPYSFAFSITPDQLDAMELMAIKFYDEVGKEEFRVWTGLDATRLKEYKQCHDRF